MSMRAVLAEASARGLTVLLFLIGLTLIGRALVQKG
jgi:hypothetical protein